MTGNIKSTTIRKKCVVLEASNIHLLKLDAYFEMIFYTMRYNIFTPHLTYFVSRSIPKLDKPMAMYWISGLLFATQKGRVQYKVINDAGGLSTLECEGYFLPDFKVRLFIPQVFIQEL